MGTVVQHNLPAINSHRQLGINNNSLSKSLEKLSSGFRINRAADDAAGLAISEKMRGQISGLTKASENSQDGISLIQTAEGALQETHSILQRMRELAVQSSNGTYQNEVDRENIAEEVQALKSEIDRISTSTHYNGIQLLDGSMQGARVTTTQGAPSDPSKGAGDVAGVSINGIVTGSPATKATFEVDLAGVTLKSKGTANDARLVVQLNNDGTMPNAFAMIVTQPIADGATLNSEQIAQAIVDGIPSHELILQPAGGLGASETFVMSAKGSKIVFTAKDPGKSLYATIAAEKSFSFGLSTNGLDNDKVEVSGTFPTGTITSTVYKGEGPLLKESNISFRDSVKENTVFEINGRRYEVIDKGAALKNGRSITNAMVMDNMNSALVVDFAAGNIGNQVASALANALTTTDGVAYATRQAGDTIGGVAVGGNRVNGYMFYSGTPVTPRGGEWQAVADGNSLRIRSFANTANVDVNVGTIIAGNGKEIPGIKAIDSITAATQSIDLQNVEYGMTVKVGSKTYEVVKNGNDVRDDKNTAVVVSDVNNFTAKSVADALFAQLKYDNTLAEAYDVKHDAGTTDITITERTPKGDTIAVGVEVANSGVTFQIGANGKADQKVSLHVDDMSSANLGVKSKLGVTSKSVQNIDVRTRNTANEAIEVIDSAINQVSGTRANMGALQNRLEHTVKNLDVAAENLTASESRIRDVDMAKEMMSFSKSQITSQAAQAMLAQANTLPQGVLQLLQ